MRERAGCLSALPVSKRRRDTVDQDELSDEIRGASGDGLEDTKEIGEARLCLPPEPARDLMPRQLRTRRNVLRRCRAPERREPGRHVQRTVDETGGSAGMKARKGIDDVTRDLLVGSKHLERRGKPAARLPVCDGIAFVSEATSERDLRPLSAQ